LAGHWRAGSRTELCGPSADMAFSPGSLVWCISAGNAACASQATLNRGAMQIIRRRVPQALDTLLDAGIDHVLARIYAARGVRNASELDHALAGLPSWTTLKGIDAAAARLANAVHAGQRILIVAD